MKKTLITIRKEFRRSGEARYIHRLHGVLLVLLGLSTVKAAKLLGEPQRTVAHWVIQFRKHGLDALWDAKKSGRPEKLNALQKKSLIKAIAKPPFASGLNFDRWTGALIASHVQKKYGVRLTARYGERLLQVEKDSNKNRREHSRI